MNNDLQKIQEAYDMVNKSRDIRFDTIVNLKNVEDTLVKVRYDVLNLGKIDNLSVKQDFKNKLEAIQKQITEIWNTLYGSHTGVRNENN